MATRWSSEQREWLRLFSDIYTDKECAQVLSKSPKAIKLKRHRLGIAKSMGRPRGEVEKVCSSLSQYLVMA